MTLRIVAHQALLSMEFSRWEYWSGLPLPPPGKLPDPGIKPMSLVPPALAGGFLIAEPAGKPLQCFLNRRLMCWYSLEKVWSCLVWFLWSVTFCCPASFVCSLPGIPSRVVCYCCYCWVTSVVSDPVLPQRWQPTRLPRPWDSPGKNTGVGCYFLLHCMKVKSESEVAQSCLTSLPHGLQPTRLLHPWDFPGKSTGVGCRCLLRG